MHLVVSYDVSVRDAGTASRYTEEIAEYYADTFQTVQCIHRETQRHDRYFFHSHIVANSVSYQNGKMFHSGLEEMAGFREHVEDVTGCKAKVDFEKTKRK